MKRTEFCEYIKTYKYQLYIIAYAVLKNAQDAEDAVCSAILKGYEHLGQLRSSRKFKAWMITITKNEALQIKRKRLDMPGDEKLEELLEPVHDVHNELWDVVQALKEEYRLVIVLFYYNDLPIWEIAKVLDIPVGTVKSRLNRGRKFKAGIGGKGGRGMTKFDKKIRELSRNIEIPKGYGEKVDNVLKTLPERSISSNTRRKWSVNRIVAFAVCMVFVICILSINTIKTDANVFSVLKMSIMDFLYGEDKDAAGEKGVGSNKTYVKSKQDLVIELKETVVDRQNLYLMVQVTAPADMELNEDISFDYVALCKGENFNVENKLGGVISCTLLEVVEGQPNVATYVLSMLSDDDFVDGEDLTAHFRDLERYPNEPEPEILVEGAWSVSFTSDLTTRKEVSVEGTPDMTYPYAGTTATLKKIRITPLGMAVISDISLAPFDELGVMDTTIAIRLKMVDGSEQLVIGHDMEEGSIIGNGSTYLDNGADGKNYQTDRYEFLEAMDIRKIVGVYIEDLYVPVGGY